MVNSHAGAGSAIEQFPGVATSTDTQMQCFDHHSVQCVVTSHELLAMQVQEVSVSGSRYWPQQVSNEGQGGTLDALYRTHTLYVQRKSGALSYVQDPSGVRSLLSTAFHKVYIALGVHHTLVKSKVQATLTNLGKFGMMSSCLMSTMCLFPAHTKSLRTSLPGKLRLAPHAPSPGWHALLAFLLLVTYTDVAAPTYDEGPAGSI